MRTDARDIYTRVIATSTHGYRQVADKCAKYYQNPGQMRTDARAAYTWAAEMSTQGYEQAEHYLGKKTVKVIAGVGATTAVLSCPFVSIPMAVTTASTAMGLTAATAYAVTENELSNQGGTLVPLDRARGVQLLRQVPHDQREEFVQQSYNVPDQNRELAAQRLLAFNDAAARREAARAVTTLQIPLEHRGQALNICCRLNRDERAELIGQANQLQVDPNQRIHCLATLARLPRPERAEFVRLMNNFVAPTDQRHRFAPILAQMTAPERTDAFIRVANGFLRIEDLSCKLEALQVYANLPDSATRANILPRARGVVHEAATDSNRVKVFCALCRIGDQFMAALGVRPILSVDHPAYQNWEIALEAISRCPENRREEIYNAASRIYGSLLGSKKNPDCAKLAKLIELLNEDPNLDVDNLIREAGKACSFWMSQDEKLQIIQEMAKLLPKERERAIGLINPFMSVSERVAVIKACRQATAVVYQLACRNISWWMGGAQRAKILGVLSTCPDRLRNALLTTVQPVLCWSRRAEILNLEQQAAVVVGVVADGERQQVEQAREQQRNQEEQQRVQEIQAAEQARQLRIQQEAQQRRAAREAARQQERLRRQQGAGGPREPQVVLHQNYAKLILDPRYVKQKPREVLKKLFELHMQYTQLPNIKFMKPDGTLQEGQDAGGLTRELMTLLMQGLYPADAAANLPTAARNPGDPLLPIIDTAQPTEEQVQCYKSMGMLFAKALRDGTFVLGNYFDPALFAMIHSFTQAQIDAVPLNIATYDQIPENTRKSLEKALLKNKFHQMFDSNDLDNEIEAFVEQGTVSATLAAINLGDTKAEIYEALGIQKIVCATTVIAKSMQMHLADSNDWDAAKRPNADELQGKIEGTVSREALMDALQFTMAQLNVADRSWTQSDPVIYNESNSKAKQYIAEWLSKPERTTDDYKKFLKFITGNTTLGPASRITITTYPPRDGVEPIVVHTCFNRMELCVDQFASYDAFEEALHAAMGVEGFQMQ